MMAAGTGWAVAGDAATWQAAVEADAFCRDYPRYDTWWEPRHGARPAFVAHRLDDGPGPWALVTCDPAELRAALAATEALWDAAAVAVVLHVSTRTVYRLAASAVLPAVREGRALRFPESVIRGYLTGTGLTGGYVAELLGRARPRGGG